MIEAPAWNVGTTSPLPRSSSGADREGCWPTENCHPIQNVASHQRLNFLRRRMASPKFSANNRLVSEEGVLHSGLAMIARLFLPPPAPDCLHSHDSAIASTGLVASSSRSRRCLDRRNDDFGAAFSCCIVDRGRVICCIRCDACNVTLNRIDEIKGGLRVVSTPVSQGPARRGGPTRGALLRLSRPSVAATQPESGF